MMLGLLIFQNVSGVKKKKLEGFSGVRLIGNPKSFLSQEEDIG